MAERRIQRYFDGCLRPTMPTPPVMSSVRGPWTGFLMEWDPCCTGRADSVGWRFAEIIMVTAGGVIVDDPALGSNGRFYAGPGSITLWPADHESRSSSWTVVDPPVGSATMVSVELDTSVLAQLAPEINTPRFTMQRAIDDPALAAMVRLMEADVRSGCATGRIYGESLCLAMTTLLRARYGAGGQMKEHTKAGLSPRQRERVLQYIAENLSGDLGLAELAGAAALSQQHFSLAFRRSFGTTPHQYVLCERITRAKTLLSTRRLSIADVAMAVGFAGQSHFTTVFHKIVGVTPRNFRMNA